MVDVEQELRQLCRLYRVAQRYRIGLGNRLSAIVDHEDLKNPSDLALGYRTYYRVFSELERRVALQIAAVVTRHPMWAWLSLVQGVGPQLAAELLVETGGSAAMAKRDTPSKLWAFAGLVPNRAVSRGKSAPFNRRLRSLLYVIGMSMLRRKSPFSVFYYDSVVRYKTNRPDWTSKHVHLASLRRMNKVFLACFWRVFREQLGLPVRKPYAIEYLGHTTEIDPWQIVSHTRTDTLARGASQTQPRYPVPLGASSPSSSQRLHGINKMGGGSTDGSSATRRRVAKSATVRALEGSPV